MSDKRLGGIGPSLPPGWQDPSSGDESDTEIPTSSATSQSRILGPTLPPGLQVHSDSDESEEGDTDIGPRIGPALPDVVPTSEQVEAESDGESETDYGPALPPDLVQKEEEEVTEQVVTESADLDIGPEIGPTLPGQEGESAESYEERLLDFKIRKHLKESSKSKREEWMTELPTKLTTYGLGPRTFRKSAATTDGDTTEWTDSPADKARKAMLGGGEPTNSTDRLKRKAVSERDEEQRKRADELMKSSGESLIDLHQKKMKKDTTLNDGERVAFDREKDLNIPRQLAGGVDGLKKRAGALSSKFSHGSGAQYL